MQHTFFHYIGQIVVIVLGIIAVAAFINGAMNPRPKRKTINVPDAPPQRRGKVKRRELIEGIEGMGDSYIAEIVDYGDADIRLLIFDICHELMVEVRPGSMKAFAGMIREFNDEQAARILRPEDAK